MFDALSDRLDRVSTRLRGKGRISETDLDEALDLAKQVPMPFGGVEVRPIRTFA